MNDSALSFAKNLMFQKFSCKKSDYTGESEAFTCFCLVPPPHLLFTPRIYTVMGTGQPVLQQMHLDLLLTFSITTCQQNCLHF